MKQTFLFSLLTLAALLTPSLTAAEQHLFILSGQSNMSRLDPDISFRPAVEAAFSKENITIVHDAVGGRPIRRWYKDWKPAQGEMPEGAMGDLYDRLMAKVKTASKGKTFTTVTFLWMQGERDANEENGEVYLESMKGLIQQLERDLARDDVNTVIGRLSDFDLDDKNYRHWTLVRKAQEELARKDSSISLVDTDDLNDGLNEHGKEIKNDLHYSVEGYRIFGQRLAEKAIKLIQGNTKK